MVAKSINLMLCFIGILLAIPVTECVFKEIKKLKTEYNDFKPGNYQSEKLIYNMQTTIAFYVMGVICLISAIVLSVYM